MDITRTWCMPNKNTFEIKPIKELLVRYVDKDKLLWIDPYANRNKWATITNDLSLEFDTDYHLDALEFLNCFEENSVDGVLFDPPYFPRQVMECYNNVGIKVTQEMTSSAFYSKQKQQIGKIVKKGGYVITCGWNSG